MHRSVHIRVQRTACWGEDCSGSDPAIWLVQGVIDTSVQHADCALRIWGFLSEGESVRESVHDDGYSAGYTTVETLDNKYRLKLYKTTDVVETTNTLGNTIQSGKIVVAEDYDLDGEYTPTKYSDHWTPMYRVTRIHPVIRSCFLLVHLLQQVIRHFRKAEAD